MDTWHHLRGLLEASSSRNLEKIHFHMSPQQFRMMVRSGKSISFIFVFLERFAWLCENFAWLCEITFHVSLVCCSQAYSVSFHMTMWKFRMVMRNRKTCFFNSSLQFLSFLSLDSISTTSKSWSKLIALLLSLCIWIIINFICFLQFDSFLLSPIYQKHTSKWLQNFIKLVSNSCKSNNMLIECFRHNYYSKEVKLMRISI